MNDIADQCLKEASHYSNNRVGHVLKDAVAEMSRLEAIVLELEANLAHKEAYYAQFTLVPKP